MFQKFFDQARTRIKSSANLQSVLILIFWTFASRGFGIVREALVGRLSPLEADIFNASSVINEFIVATFIVGSIGVAMLPQLIKLDVEAQKTPGAQNKVSIYLSWSMLILCTMVAAMCLAGIIWIQPILQLLNSNLYQSFEIAGRLGDYILLNRLFLIAPIIFCAKTILGVFLNSKKSFYLYSLDGIITNLGSVLGLSVLYSLFKIQGAAIGLLLGFLATTGLYLWDAWRLGLKFQLQVFPGLGGYLKQTAILLWPRFLIFSNVRLAELLVTATAIGASGDITAVKMALNLQGIIYGIMLAVGTVFLPDLTIMLVDKGRTAEFWAYLYRYLRLGVIIGLVGGLGSIIVAPLILWIIQLISFSSTTSFIRQDSIVRSILIFTAICAISVVFQTVGEILNRYFIASEKVWVPIIASVSATLSSIAISFGLASTLGAGLAAIIGFLVNCILITIVSAYFTWRDWVGSKNEILVQL